MLVSIQRNKVSYDKNNKTFTVSGKDVRFAYSYTLVNNETDNKKDFSFKESTGSEWDPNTIWVYESEDGFILNVKNDDVTPEHAEKYLQAKLRN
jgi:hypothetical protein